MIESVYSWISRQSLSRNLALELVLTLLFFELELDGRYLKIFGKKTHTGAHTYLIAAKYASRIRDSFLSFIRKHDDENLQVWFIP